MKTSSWYNCYDSNWKGLITDDAFQHPAKYARGLIERIIDHGIEWGFWAPRDLIGDPFGGIGTGGIICASGGLRWVGVELEERFVELGRQNFEIHRRIWEAFGDPLPVLVQGDSRQFASIVAGEMDAVVTSPPYAETLQGAHCETETAGESRAKRVTAGGSLGQSQRHRGYGVTEGNIGNLKEGVLDGAVTSPPYADSTHSNPADKSFGGPAVWAGGGDSGARVKNDYAVPSSAGQIGALKEGVLDGCVTSPPYSDQAVHDRNGIDRSRCERPGQNSQVGALGYGSAPGQIGREAAETYWEAMRQVYRQCHLALRPGGVMAVVVKDFVRAKKRVPLCDQTCQLLESLGFDVFSRTRAWLVKESRHPDLFGGEDHVTTTERKSFFRRLAEKKGSPRIDWEEVLWARKTGAPNG